MPQDVTQAIEAILEPLRRQDAELEAKRDELKAELEEVNRERAKVAGILRAAEKSLGVTPSKPGPGRPPRKRPEKSIPAERAAELETYLREKMDGQGFTLSDLLERNDWLGWDRPYLHTGVRTLHAQGTLRLLRPSRGKSPALWQVASRHG